ncbi:MAG: SRPBCC domain-containing protein [Candidatus Udaeobacter sp.]
MTTEQNLAEGVVVERTFDAPLTRVWKALTDVNEMRQWYFDLKEFKPEVGFEFEFVVEHEGTTCHHLCRVTEVIPQQKIAYTWRYKAEPGDSLVTFELFDEGKKTRVKLTHTGIETFPKTPAYARKNFEAGWTAIIGSELKQFVEKKEKGKS